ncbi:hypothetical protein DPMN_156935 [Dreissena polymorpha]|uniref:Uncharacterized protein n=1 Tax=Dreissena polymorpha TaxID=45954 RepID=A0A9D4FU24_DREPO|nr:hypothetical protein DPMN_156935 [Dreissena polymorpha]
MFTNCLRTDGRRTLSDHNSSPRAIAQSRCWAFSYVAILFEAIVIQDDNECSYDQIHKAIGILRRRIIENKPKFDDFFYAPEKIKLSDQKQFVEPLLYKAKTITRSQQNIASHKITDSGGIVPDNILPRDQRGKLVVADDSCDDKHSTRIPRLPKATITSWFTGVVFQCL